MPIHPTAIVDPRRAIAETAEIGPYCIIGAEVEIGARTRLMANIYLEGPTWIGEDNIFFPYSTVGVASQDLKYKGERAETRIGNRNRIREFVTIHRGTAGRRAGHQHRRRQPADGLHPRGARRAASAITSSWPTASTLAGHVTIGDWADISALQRRAPVLPHRPPRLHRPLQRGEAGRDAVLRSPVGKREMRRLRRQQRRPGAARLRKAGHRSAADRLPPADARASSIPRQAIERIRAEVPPCAEVDELLEFIRTSRARRREVRCATASSPATAASRCWRWKARGSLGHDVTVIAIQEEASPEVEALAPRCHWISLGATQQADRDLQAGGHHRGGDVRPGEARQDLLLDPARLAAGQTAGHAALEEYRRPDRRRDQSAGRRRHSPARFHRAAEAAAGHRRAP